MAEQDYWSECGRRGAFAASNALGRLHRSVFSFENELHHMKNGFLTEVNEGNEERNSLFPLLASVKSPGLGRFSRFGSLVRGWLKISNQQASGKARLSCQLTVNDHCPGLPEAER